MIIRKCDVDVNFKYFWMKTVTGVNLDRHCMECLVGKRDNRITPTVRSYQDVELPDEIHYLCGVVYPYNWSKNFHLAFRPCEGKTLTETQNGVTICIEGAEKLPISPEFISPDNPHYNDKSYYTCRNWQFAHWFHKNCQQPAPEPERQ